MKKLVLFLVLMAAMAVSFGVLSGNSANYIVGIEPSDIYLNLEKRGIDKQGPRRVGSDHPEIWLWELKSQTSLVPDKVEIWSRDGVTKVYKVVVKSLHPNKALAAFVATMPYDGANPDQAKSWVESNYSNNGASTVIGGVPFEIISMDTITILKIGFSID